MKSRTLVLLPALCAVLFAAPSVAQETVRTNPPAPVPVTSADAQVAFQTGIAAYKAGDLPLAETELAKATAGSDASGDANGWYGFILLKRNKPAAAVPFLEKAVAQKPEVADHCTNLGNALLLKPGRTAADTTRALEAFRKATAIAPDSGEAQFNLGLAYTRLARPKDAAPVYRRATELNPKDDRAFLALGQTYVGLKDFDSAAKAFRAAAAITPQKADVWTNLGVAEAKRPRPDRGAAINALETARKLDGGTALTLTTLGKLYAETGKPAESAAAFAAATAALDGKNTPEAAAILYNQGVMYTRLGKPDDALTAYNKALEAKPDYFDAAFNAGTLHYNAARYADATRLFLSATKANPLSSVAWMNLGLSLQKQSDETGTVAAWKRAAELQPSDYAIRDALGAVYLRRKAYGDAIAVYRQNTRLRPASGAAWNALGLAQQKSGDYEGAIASFTTASKKEPRYAPAYNNLGVVYEKRAQFKLAVAAYKKALQVDPTFAPALANLARYDPKPGTAKL